MVIVDLVPVSTILVDLTLRSVAASAVELETPNRLSNPAAHAGYADFSILAVYSLISPVPPNIIIRFISGATRCVYSLSRKLHS